MPNITLIATTFLRGEPTGDCWEKEVPFDFLPQVGNTVSVQEMHEGGSPVQALKVVDVIFNARGHASLVLSAFCQAANDAELREAQTLLRACRFTHVPAK